MTRPLHLATISSAPSKFRRNLTAVTARGAHVNARLNLPRPQVTLNERTPFYFKAAKDKPQSLSVLQEGNRLQGRCRGPLPGSEAQRMPRGALFGQENGEVPQRVSHKEDIDRDHHQVWQQPRCLDPPGEHSLALTLNLIG